MSFQYGDLPESIRCGGVKTYLKFSCIDDTIVSVTVGSGVGSEIKTAANEARSGDVILSTYINKERVGLYFDNKDIKLYPMIINTNGAGECDGSLFTVSEFGFGCGRNMLMRTGMYKTLTKLHNPSQIRPPEAIMEEAIKRVHI